MAFAPDGRLFVTEKTGKLRIIKNGVLLPTPFLTVPVTSDNERGLIGVTFDIDANGILNVSAKDKATGKSSSIKITASSGLSKEEVERMQKEAELHKAEDEKKKEVVELKNVAEQMLYTADKSLKDFKDKIPADVTKTIEDKVTALKVVKDGTDAGAIKSATEALSAELQKIGDIVNKAQAAEPSKEAPKEGGDPNVRDAEFKEKK
jgi:molecular chaperone DnaK